MTNDKKVFDDFKDLWYKIDFVVEASILHYSIYWLSPEVDEIPEIGFKRGMAIDFHIERYPIPDEEKAKIMKAFWIGAGVYAPTDSGKYLLFTNSSPYFEYVSSPPLEFSEKLPSFWKDYLELV